MSIGQTDLYGFIGERFTFGVTTTPYGVSLMAGQCEIIIKMIAGGTMEISGASFAAGNGYPMNTSESICATYRDRFFVQASGATIQFAVLRGRTSGFNE